MRNKSIGVRVSLPFGVRPENGKEVEQRGDQRPRFAHTVPINNRKSRPEPQPANKFSSREPIYRESCEGRPRWTRSITTFVHKNCDNRDEERLAAMIMTGNG